MGGVSNVDREAAVVDVERLAAEAELGALLDRARDGHRVGDRHGIEVGRQVERGSDAVDHVGPLEGRVAEEHAGHGQLDRVLALGQGLLDQLGLHQVGGTDPHGATVGLRLEVVEQRHPVHLQVRAEQLVARVERDRDVEVAGDLGGEGSPVVDPGGRDLDSRRPPERHAEPEHDADRTEHEHQEEEVDLAERARPASLPRSVQPQRAGGEVELAAARRRPQAPFGPAWFAGAVGPGDVLERGRHRAGAAARRRPVCPPEAPRSHRGGRSRAPAATGRPDWGTDGRRDRDRRGGHRGVHHAP